MILLRDRRPRPSVHSAAAAPSPPRPPASPFGSLGRRRSVSSETVWTLHVPAAD